jgi:hypothetical protein
VRRVIVLVVAASVAIVVAMSGVAGACGSLVAANGAVDLERTTTLAAYHDGVEHYVTSFQFEGDATSFGSIVPLPGKPSKVERGGDWTLQRLEREVQPPVLAESAAAPKSAADGVEVIEHTTIDSLDINILRGGGRAVAAWAKENGFDLTRDTPEVLDFYSQRSPYFMAARFDATSAVAQGLDGGDGIPVHLTIPVDNPWVPLRILATAMPANETVQADVFLLTDKEPTLLHGDGFSVDRSERASSSLLDDLRSDKGMGWVGDDMWLTYGQVDAHARDLTTDLAIDVEGDQPDITATGVSDFFSGSDLTWQRGTG